ncbi:MAG: D-aminoacyl-tRNA deacylase [Bacteroidota bacterium]
MRALIQRVSQASVVVDDQTIGQIEKGLLVLLGVTPEDNQTDIEWLAGKIARLRIFNDAEGLMNLSLQDVDGNALVVSQFTLYASTKKGNRPSYIRAARPEQAIPLYEAFCKQLSFELNKQVQTGQFGAMMQVSLVNDGPTTIWIDSKSKE